MKDYKVIHAYTMADLEDSVIEYIHEGYELCGGLSVICDYNTDNKHYYQAVVKYN